MSEGEQKQFWLDRDWEKYPPRNVLEIVAKYHRKLVIDPLTTLKTYLSSLKGEPYYWYHRQYRRVPTIDQCYDYDIICMYEADKQFERDRKVDGAIVNLLKSRAEDCMIWEGQERERCRPFFDALEQAETNFFIKYGDMALHASSYTAFMKQKHRMAWERRHGPVGSGMKKKHFKSDGTVYYE